jgi:hypothetical protein
MKQPRLLITGLAIAAIAAVGRAGPDEGRFRRCVPAGADDGRSGSGWR